MDSRISWHPLRICGGLRVVVGLVSIIAALWPEGIDFKLDKESYGFKDGKEIPKRNQDEKKMLMLLHVARANYLAKSISLEGFRCKPDGSMKIRKVEFGQADLLAWLLIQESPSMEGVFSNDARPV